MRELKIKDFELPNKLEREDNEIKILFFLSKNKKSQPQDIYDTLRMSSSSFYNKKPILEKSGLIRKETDSRKAYLSITENGLIYLQEKLAEIGMDIKTQLEIMEKDNEILTKPYMDFLKNYKTIPDDLKTEFIKLSSKLPLNQFPVSPTKSMCMLLYLAMNHPKFYQVYSIKSSDFIQQNSKFITPIDFNFFIQEVIDDRFYNITIESNLSLYFLANSNYGQIVESIIKMVIENDYYLKAQDKSDQKFKDRAMYSDSDDFFKKRDIKEQIIENLIENFHLFPVSIRDSIYQIVNQFFDRFKIEDQDLSTFPIALGLKQYGVLDFTREYAKTLLLYPYIHIRYHVQDLFLSNDFFFDNFSIHIQRERSKIINIIYSNIVDVEEIAIRTQIKFDSRETMILQAILCLKRSNYSKALDYGQKLETLYPEKYIGILIQAYVFFYFDQRTKSLQIINSFTSINIESPVLRFFKLLILYITGEKIPKLKDTIEKGLSETLSLYFKMYMAFVDNNNHKINHFIDKLSNFEENSILLEKYRILSKTGDNLLDDALNLIKTNKFRKYNDFLEIKAYIFMKWEKEQEFLEICKEMLAIEPNNTRIHIMKINFYSNQRNLKECLLEINDAITIQPKNPMLYYFKYDICIQLKEYDSALEASENAIALAPSSSIFLWTKLTALNLKFSKTRAHKFLRDRNWGSFLESSIEILKAKKKFYKVAQELMEHNQEEEAFKFIVKAIKSAPNNPKYKALKAKILSNLKKKKEALISINNAIELDSNNFKYLKQKIEILNEFQEYEKALQSISHYIKKKPKDPVILNMKAKILSNLKKNTEALISINNAIELDSNNFKYIQTKINILKKLARFEDCLTYIEELIKNTEKPSNFLYEKAYILIDLKRKEEAIATMQELINIEPISIWYDSFGEILLNFKEYSLALEKLEKVISLDKDDQWFYGAYFKASVCYYALGEIKKSEEYFAIGKKKAPKDAEWIKKAKSLIQELKQT